jgi:DNA-binding XRE family transcriptional regulator
MPSGRSFYHRRPTRYATEKKEFQQLVAELKRLSMKNGYSQEQIASELGVSLVTVNHWLTGSLIDWAFLIGKAQEHRTTENVLGWSLRWTNRPF